MVYNLHTIDFSVQFHWFLPLTFNHCPILRKTGTKALKKKEQIECKLCKICPAYEFYDGITL